MKRVMMFIDGSNFLFGVKRSPFTGKIVDFRKLGEYIAGLQANRELTRIYFYGSIPDGKDVKDQEQVKKQQAFYDKLSYCGIQVTILRLRKRPDGSRYEKGVDVHLATDLLQLAFKNAYEVAIVISGDGDFVPAINAVKEQGKIVEVVSFRGAKADNIHKCADRFHFLDDILSENPHIFV